VVQGLHLPPIALTVCCCLQRSPLEALCSSIPLSDTIGTIGQQHQRNPPIPRPRYKEPSIADDGGEQQPGSLLAAPARSDSTCSDQVPHSTRCQTLDQPEGDL